MPSGSFYLTLNSNVEYPGNNSSRFTVPLAKKINFNARWCVGLSEIIFPHSWPTLGTTENQYIEIFWKYGIVIQIPLEPATFSTRQEFERQIIASIRNGIAFLKKQIQAAKKLRNRHKRGDQD